MAHRRERAHRAEHGTVTPRRDPAVSTASPVELGEVDAVTGLPHLSHLVERIQELQDRARAQPGPRRTVLPGHVLVVVSVAASADRHAAVFTAARTSSLLRAVFSGDETIALFRQGLFGVLARDRQDLAADREFLGAMLAEFEVRARVTVERVPADGPGTATLLSNLLLGGEWDPEE